MKLSILIPTIRRHERFLTNLKTELASQILPYAGEVEVLIDDHEYDSIGMKRNRLLKRATGKMVAFFDADDKPSSTYIKRLIEAADSDCDCASLKGEYSVDGKFDGLFEHSLKYKEWRTTNNEIKYERYPNHISCLKSSIAKQFNFPETNWSEDHDWSRQIHESGLLKSEYYIPEIIYYYKKLTNTMPKRFSQSEEQTFILEAFKDKQNGKFIDIGAYDIEKFSNVRALYLKGWKEGVLVEPQPQNYKAIAEHYANEKDITVLNVAIGDGNGEIDFYESNGDAVGTTDEDHMEKWSRGGVQFNKIKVNQMDVVDFFNQYGKDADFLSIDTEATNMIVFRNIPDWVWEQISMLCIEHDQQQEEIEEKLSKFGFSTLYINAENIILAKQ